MTLIDDIQNELVDDSRDLGSILRKCKILAARLGSDPLEEWLEWESEGYPSDESVPDYRTWRLELHGDFAGPFGAAIQNAPIPYQAVAPKVYDKYTIFNCRQSIASIESLRRNAKRQAVLVATPGLAMRLGDKVYRGYNCIHAWAFCPMGYLDEVVNSVRNRVLSFVLEIWKQYPDAGEGRDVHRIKPDVVTQVFYTTVNKGNANIVGSAVNSPLVFNVNQADMDSLVAALREANVEEEDILELKTAIASDPQQPSGGFGSHVSDWVGAMTAKAAKGVWSVGINVGTELLAGVLKKYYGLE